MTGRTTAYCLPGVPAEMRAIFRKSVEPEIRGKLGDLHRWYLTLELEGILESSLSPVIADELRRHPGAYIKSHPRGIKEGVSHIELDIAVVGEDGRATEGEGEAIAREMTDAVGLAGGKARPREGRG